MIIDVTVFISDINVLSGSCLEGFHVIVENGICRIGIHILQYVSSFRLHPSKDTLLLQHDRDSREYRRRFRNANGAGILIIRELSVVQWSVGSVQRDDKVVFGKSGWILHNRRKQCGAIQHVVDKHIPIVVPPAALIVVENENRNSFAVIWIPVVSCMSGHFVGCLDRHSGGLVEQRLF